MYGKSSFINKISNKNSLKASNKPGVTLKKQWVRLSKNIELLDTPGVLWPKFKNDETALNLAFTGTIKDEILDKEEIAFYLIKYLLHNNIHNLCEKYKLNENEIKDLMQSEEDENQVILQVIELCRKIKRCIYVTDGRIDTKKTSNLLLTDFREAKIERITLEKVTN